MSRRPAPPLAVVCWPFEHGSPDVGMGLGASALAEDEALHDELAAAGWSPTVERIAAADPAAGEVTRIFDLLRAQAAAVNGAVRRGAFPVVLAGGCISASGTVAGAAGGGRVGAVWLDAHADLDTPEDNLSGSMDVMALAILTGTAWQASARTIPGFAPVAQRDVALLGVRDLAPYQHDALAASAIRTAPGTIADDPMWPVAALPDHVYLHVDLDVLDTSVGQANRHAAPGGPSLERVLEAVDATFDHATVIAAALTAYEPRSDRPGSIRAAARTIAGQIAARALAQR
ncbi:MAG TPA: arginase family protein [Baekduia sp.]|nr:arginase family protein [Baekduia sp.]